MTAGLPARLLLGSGPSPVPPRVLEALATPPVGHLDPAFGAVMDDVAERLRQVLGTANPITFPVSGTGSAGMQTMADALVRPGDRVVVGVCGAFGARAAGAFARRGADVVRVEGPWGRALPPERLVEAAEGARFLFVVHGETSTGVVQDLDGLGELDAHLLVDCVTSLAGQELRLDEAGVAAAFSGTQKCLNAPPGLAPFTVRDDLVDHASASWYFDLEAVAAYWTRPDAGRPRPYHHTAPITMVLALREALALVEEEGLEARWARHAEAHERTRTALAELGFERLAPDGEALHPLLCVRVPETVPDEAALRRALLLEDGIEVSGGLGPLAGRVWRIGLMGEGARPEAQDRLLDALRRRVPSRP